MAFSRWSDAVANAILNKQLGASADTSLLGTTLYAEVDTTGPSDANGTGIVASVLARVSFSVTDGTLWPAAASRAKTSGADITFAANSSGSPIAAVFISLWTLATGGTYKGGFDLTGAPVSIANGATLVLTTGSVVFRSPGT